MKQTTLTPAEAAECLDLLDQLAAYALDGWIESGSLSEAEAKAWSERLDAARLKLGGAGSFKDTRHLRG
jgi:hypothetical protein